MAEKIFSKAFAADFTGINAECSAIEAEDGAVSRALNLEWGLSNNLRGRTGCQLASIAGQFYGTHSHSWSRTTDQYVPSYNATGQTSTKIFANGATVTELLALNQDLFVLDNLSVAITNVSGANPITWWSSVVSGNIHFYMACNGVTKLDVNCGTGLEAPNASMVSWYSVLLAIDNTAEFALALTRNNIGPVAGIHLDQAETGIGAHALGYEYRITVNAGHTFLPGDDIVFATVDSHNYPCYFAGIVTSVAATTINYVRSTYGAPTFKDNQIIGYLNTPAALFPISAVQTTSTSPFTITLPYARWVRGTPGLFLSGIRPANGAFPDGYRPPSFVSANGCAYFATANAGTSGRSSLWKYDGNTTYAAGLPKITGVTLAPTGSVTLTGDYKYRLQYKRVDAQGNIIEGPLSEPFGIIVTDSKVNVTYPNITNAVNSQYSTGWGLAAETKTITTGPIKIDNGAAGVCSLSVGDAICFDDSTGTLRSTFITAMDGNVTPMIISIASLGSITINDNAVISQATTIKIYRTTAGGNSYYLVDEVPNNGASATSVYYDTCGDTTLIGLEPLIEPDLGKEHDPPPTCSLVCEHQGGLALSGSVTNPNTVYFSSADGVEYYPLASNNLEVPSTQSGPITAIASDTMDRLAVFKEKAYYDVVGDLDGGQFTVNVVTEGDYGVTSQATLKKVRGTLIGLSKLGFIAVSNGQLIDQAFRKLNARLMNQPYLFSAAVAANDSFTRTYICSIPVSSLTSTSVTYVLDYSREGTIPTERSYAVNQQPNGCLTAHGDVLYSLNLTDYINNASCQYGAIYRRLERFRSSVAPRLDGDSFVDHVSAINYVLESQPINFGEPSVYKSPTRLRLYSIPNDYIVEGWVPFSCLLETACFPDASFFGGSSPGALTTTLSFVNSYDYYQDVKLPSAKCYLYMVRFTTNTIRQAPFFTGYEVVIALPYAKEDIHK